MKKHLIVVLIVAGLLFLGTFSVQPAQANFKPAPLPHAYIESDGSINPSSAPISRNGNAYALTGNLSGFVLEIRRSNAVFDGAGFSIPGFGYDEAILLTSVTNVTVRNFSISGRNVDIHLSASSSCTITGNRMSDAGSYGIWLTDRSDGNVISGNSVDDGFYGIYLGNSRNNVLRNNSVIGSKPTPTFTHGQNFAVVGDVLEDFINDADASNTVNGKPVYYWVNRQNAIVPPNAGAVLLVNCTNITVQNQHLMQNKYGVLLAWTSGSTVRGNTVEYDAVGIFLFHSWGNTIAENSVFESHGLEDNESHGIRIQSSYNNVISGNNVVSSMGAGICVSQSPGTRLLENRVQNNSNTGILIINHSDLFVVFRNYLAGNAGVTLRVADSAGGAIVGNSIVNRYYAVYLTGVLQGTSVYGNDFDSRGHDLLMAYVSATGANPTWDNGTIGNYWSDYLTLYPNASETETSGIGDAPYIISESNIDHYPLMAPLDASTVSMPEIESAPLPTPTPYEPLPTPTPTEASPTATPEPSPTTTPLPTEQPTATPNQPSNSPSPSPLQTEQPTASKSDTETQPESPPTMYLAAGILVASVAVSVVVAVLLKKFHGNRAGT